MVRGPPRRRGRRRTRRSWSTGAPRSPSPSTGRPRSRRWASCAGATSCPARAARSSASTTRCSTRTAVESEGLQVAGEGALLAALERNRTGRMGDIVATIQAEQDEAIRADLHGVLVVAGGPGTGKTAVALHRAAYLLYTHRRLLASRGVLLVGPSSVFLRYIEHVLPSLGEQDVQLSTIPGPEAPLARRRTRPARSRGAEGRRADGPGHRARGRSTANARSRTTSCCTSTGYACASHGATPPRDRGDAPAARNAQRAAAGVVRRILDMLVARYKAAAIRASPRTQRHPRRHERDRQRHEPVRTRRAHSTTRSRARWRAARRRPTVGSRNCAAACGRCPT